MPSMNVPVTILMGKVKLWLISLMIPLDSWVARWQRIEKCVQGCYAISVSGMDYILSWIT